MATLRIPYHDKNTFANILLTGTPSTASAPILLDRRANHQQHWADLIVSESNPAGRRRPKNIGEQLTKEFRIVTTTQLQELVRNSEKANLNRLPKDSLWESIDPNGLHVLNPMQVDVVGKSHFVRTFAMCKLNNASDPTELFIDFKVDDWNQLSAN